MKTENKETVLLTRNRIAQQVKEMWDAIGLIENDDPDRDYAIQQARNVESRLYEQFDKQEAIRNAAPDMLEALKEIRGWYEKNHVEYLGEYTPVCFSKALSAILKAEGNQV